MCIRDRFRTVLASLAPAVFFLFEGFLVLLLCLMILGVEAKFRAVLAGIAPGVFLLAFLKNLQGTPPLAQVALTVVIEVQEDVYKRQPLNGSSTTKTPPLPWPAASFPCSPRLRWWR